MGIQARVTSIDTLETFRAALIIFVTKARQAADSSTDQAKRMRAWLQNEQRMHWEGEIRRRRRALEQAEQDLYAARLSGLSETVTVRQVAVRKARRVVEEAEEKLASVKRWSQNFDNRADPLLKKLDGLRDFLEHEIPNATAFLFNAQKSLEEYAAHSAPAAASPSMASAGSGSETSVTPHTAAPQEPPQPPAPISSGEDNRSSQS